MVIVDIDKENNPDAARTSDEGCLALSDKAPGSRECSQCACLREQLINVTEDAREFERKFSEIRNEGERLYQSYEIKCSKLKDAIESNISLSDENQRLYDQNQSLAERLAMAQQKLANVACNAAQPVNYSADFDRVNRLCEQQAKMIDELRAQLSEERLEAQQKIIGLNALVEESKKPPFELKLEVVVPNRISAAEARAAELYTVADSEILQGMSSQELREQIDQICISNQLLRDEARELNAKVIELEQKIAKKETTIEGLQANVQRTSDFEARASAHENELHAVQGDLNSALKACSELQREREDLISRIDRLSHQIDSERRTFQAEAETSVATISDLERQVTEAKAEISRIRGAEVQLGTIREEEQKLRAQLVQQEAAYKNAQADLRRVYAKHKKDLADLEATYRQGDYIQRYERLALRSRHVDTLAKAVNVAVPRVKRLIEMNHEIANALCQNKQQLSSEWQMLEQQRAEAEKRVDDLESELQDATRQRHDLCRQLDTLKSRMASLEQDIEWERQQKQELVLEKERAIAEIKYVQIQTIVRATVSEAVHKSQTSSIVSSLRKDIEQQKKEFEAQTSALADREWELCKARTAVEEEAAANSLRQSQLESELARLQDLEIKAASGQSELRRLRREKEELTEFIEQERQISCQRIVDLEYSNRMLTDELTAAQATIHSLQTSMDSREPDKELQIALETIAALEQQIQADAATAEERLEMSTQDAAGFRQQVQELAVLLQSRDATIIALREEIARLNDRSANDARSFAEQLESARAQTATAAERTAAFESKIAKLRQKVKDISDEKTDLEARNNELTAELEDAEAHAQRQLDISKDTIACLKVERDDLQRRLEDLSSRAASLEGRCEATETRHAMLMESHKLVDGQRQHLQSRVEELERQLRSDVDAYKQKMAELERVNESIVEQLRAAGSSSAPPDLSEGSPLHEELARLRETLETERAEAAAKQQSMRRSLHDYKSRGDKKLAAYADKVKQKSETIKFIVDTIKSTLPSDHVLHEMASQVSSEIGRQ
ncbi:GRIP domain-containing protein [Plasmodiophora brassicae]|uniref:Uncharacterized protein n=1 Tax=Plasmodiophora brassicae TaxID=37360 RepID=A0A3P3YIW2_PLABS|nr:unnamed protein product [Plasmodiophora brassicae]